MAVKKCLATVFVLLISGQVSYSMSKDTRVYHNTIKSRGQEQITSTAEEKSPHALWNWLKENKQEQDVYGWYSFVLLALELSKM